MKTAGVFLAIAVALALQTTLAHFVMRGTGALDLLLVVVVYVGLVSGPVAGLLVGALSGLAQDTLSATGAAAVSATGAITLARSIIGVGGLAKTVVGFMTGVVGTQFIVTALVPRLVVFFCATVVHAVIFLGLSVILDLRLSSVPYGPVAVQAVGNAIVGGVAFQLIEGFPGFLERRRATRGRMRVGRHL
jgi:cell shape-determining protein MreD